MNNFSWHVLQILNDTDTFKELQLNQIPSLIGHYRIPYLKHLYWRCGYSSYIVPMQLTFSNLLVHTQMMKMPWRPSVTSAPKGVGPHVLCLILLNWELLFPAWQKPLYPRESLSASYNFRCVSLFSFFQILMILSYLT